MRWNYYKLRQLSLLQSAMDCYYKLRQLFYYKVRHGLLQIATGITKCDGFITNCDRYCKVRWLLQIATVHVPTVAYLLGLSIPRSQCVSGRVVAHSPRIRQRNVLTEKGWENAVQGLGNTYCSFCIPRSEPPSVFFLIEALPELTSGLVNLVFFPRQTSLSSSNIHLSINRWL